MAATKAMAELVVQAARILGPLDRWAAQCHAASLKVVQEATFTARVARGSCDGVGGQHSWVVVGDDCYDRGATIIDPTLWSYDASVEGIWVGTMADGRHRPFGLGSIWQRGRPHPAVGRAVRLTPTTPFSDRAESFLDMLGPLDLDGWALLAHAPVEGWPADEILAAMCDTPHPEIPGVTLGGRIPIDTLGMVTDRNPGGLYLANGGLR
jgi:hypothetical protein